MDPEQLLLESLDDLERISAFVCRKRALHESEREDFTSFVKLKLIENDYAILRKFEGRSSLGTYLSVVVHRLLLDYRNHLLGKWRPSAEAKRLGATAILLETLTHRDRLTFEEAIQRVETQHPEVGRAEISRVAALLPSRPPRWREVALEELSSHPAMPADSIERQAESDETTALARRTGHVIRRAIDAMPESERLVLRMRFEAEMSVVEIARVLRTESTPLYRRIYRSLGSLRLQLEREGVSASDVERIVGGAGGLDFGMTSPPMEVARRSKEEMQA